MLFNLFTSLIDQYSFLNVFKYLTFRTGLSVVTSLIVVFVIGGPLIKLFSEKMITGPIRQDGPIDHIIKKSGTPTMGGVIIIIGIISSTILWADLKNIYIWTLIFVSLALGVLGLIDDILKIKHKNSQLNANMALQWKLWSTQYRHASDHYHGNTCPVCPCYQWYWSRQLHQSLPCSHL